MSIKSVLLGSVAAATITVNLHADSGFSIAGGALFGSTLDQPLQSGALLVLVTSATNTFTGPEAGSLISGDERILGTFSADIDVLGENGGFSTTISFLLGDGIVAGKQFALLWFPSLTEGDIPVGGESYGFYTDASWLVPVDGALESYAYENDHPAVGGSIPSSTGLANRIVPGGAIPEPSSFAAIAGFGMLGFAAMRKRRRA